MRYVARAASEIARTGNRTLKEAGVAHLPVQAQRRGLSAFVACA
jgi:hypothetical protein